MTGFRTLAFGLATVVFGFLQTFDFTSIGLSTSTNGIIIAAIGGAIVVLRALTSTPIGTK